MGGSFENSRGKSVKKGQKCPKNSENPKKLSFFA
jgi:hypothetical protein